MSKENIGKFVNSLQKGDAAQAGDDLKNALEKKEIKGAALDVFKNEPLEESGFYNLDNIILTPHIAASTDEAQIVVAEMVANQFVEFFNNNKIINSVT